MRILKHIPTWIRTTLVSRLGATVPKDAEVEILAQGVPDVVYPGLVTDKNSAIRCKIGNYLTGAVYNKVMLSEYWRTIAAPDKILRGLVITAPRVTCTYDILKDINNYTGLDFAESDIHNLDIPDGDLSSITVDVTESCLWFSGEISINLHRTISIVEGNVITPVDIDLTIAKAVTTAYTGIRYNPNMLTYDINYTDDVFLAGISTFTTATGTPDAINNTVGTSLAARLKALDGQPWRCVTTSANYPTYPFNLYEYYVVYNGPVEDYAFALCNQALFKSEGFNSRQVQLPRLDQKFVLVLAPGPAARSTDLTPEPIFIHYGGARVATPYRQPVHYWPLNDTRQNFGTDPKKPEFAVQGQFFLDNNDGVRAHKAALAGTAVIGADLPIDRDFTINFNGRCQDIGNGRTYFRDSAVSNFRLDLSAYGLTLTGQFEAVHTLSNNYTPEHRWATYTLARRGDWWLSYVNGEIVTVYKGGNQTAKVLNTMIHAYVANGTLMRDFTYFDYGLTGDQIRALPNLLPATEAVAAPLPQPLHHWPLEGNFVNLGTSKQDLQPFCEFRDITIEGELEKWAYRKNNVRTLLSVPLKVDRDFTLTFDYYTTVGSMGYSGMFNGPDLNNTKSGLWFYNFVPYLVGEIGTPSPDACTAAMKHRVQFVKRGKMSYVYLNGNLWSSTTWLDASTTEWTHFGLFGGYYFSDYQSFKNLRYYAEALTMEQLANEPGVNFK